MADAGVTVGLALDTSAYEQGIRQAEEALRSLDAGMTASVSRMQSLCSQLMGAWSAVNSSIQQAVNRAGQLRSMSAVPAAAQSSGNGLLERSLTQAISGLAIQLDGQKVGALVAPVVNSYIGDQARGRRFELG